MDNYVQYYSCLLIYLQNFGMYFHWLVTTHSLNCGKLSLWVRFSCFQVATELLHSCLRKLLHSSWRKLRFNMFCSDENVCNNLVYDENPEQLETGHFGFGFGDISKAIYPNWGSWSGILLTMVKYSTVLVATKYIWDVISKLYRWCTYMRMFNRLYGHYCPWKAGMESSMLEEAYSRTVEMVKEMTLKPNGGDLETGFTDRSVVPASNDA